MKKNRSTENASKDFSAQIRKTPNYKQKQKN